MEDSKGYFADNGTPQPSVWIIDYTLHRPQLNSITAVEGVDKCSFLDLSISKSDDLSYYLKSGVPISLKRRYGISYNTLKWNATAKEFDDIVESKEEAPTTSVRIKAPLKDTQITLSDEPYSTPLGLPKESITSDEYKAVTIEMHMDTVVVNVQAAGNVTGGDKDVLSAPAEVEFYCYANTPVAKYFIWRIYNDAEKPEYIIQYSDQKIKYTFDKQGAYTITLEVTNGETDNPCQIKDSITFKVSDWKLDVPNFFSPGDSPGVNDEFRVAYKSIVKFKCSIFNRWGNKLYEFNDPAKGWDGRYNGKFVSPGVYFYVIEFEGSDRISRTKAGDINIIRSK